MTRMESYVCCMGCGNRWPENDQATYWVTSVSKCCNLPLSRVWDRPEQSSAIDVTGVFLMGSVAGFLAILGYLAILTLTPLLG